MVLVLRMVVAAYDPRLAVQEESLTGLELVVPGISTWRRHAEVMNQEADHVRDCEAPRGQM